MLPTPEQQALLYREARYLDCQEWQAWMDLYTDKCVFWMPTWRDEVELCNSPDTELSLIRLLGRDALEDRVWRATSGLSVASTPLPRTAHAVNNILAQETGKADFAQLTASWTTHIYYPKTRHSQVFFGLYEYDLRLGEPGWQIERKKIILLNDQVPTSLDFYGV